MKTMSIRIISNAPVKGLWISRQSGTKVSVQVHNLHKKNTRNKLT